MFKDLIPYTDIHELNLDWLIKNVKKMYEDFDKLDEETKNEIQELRDLFYGDIQQQVETYVQENLSQFLLGAMYDEPNTSIKLQQAEVIGDSDHVYNNENESIIVLEGR